MTSCMIQHYNIELLSFGQYGSHFFLRCTCRKRYLEVVKKPRELLMHKMPAPFQRPYGLRLLTVNIHFAVRNSWNFERDPSFDLPLWCSYGNQNIAVVKTCAFGCKGKQLLQGGAKPFRLRRRWKCSACGNQRICFLLKKAE